MTMDSLRVGQNIARVLYGYTFPDNFKELSLGLPFDPAKPHWNLHDFNERQTLHARWQAFSERASEWYEVKRRDLRGQYPIVPDCECNPIPVQKWHVFPPQRILGCGVQFSSIGQERELIHTNDSLEFAVDGPNRRISNLHQINHNTGVTREISSYFFEDSQPMRFMIRGAASVFWREVPEGFHWEDKSIGNARVLARAVYDKIKHDLSLNEAREVPYAERNDWDLSRKPDKAFSLIPEGADDFLPPVRVSVHECFVPNDPRHFGWIVEVTVYGTPGIAESAAMASLWQAGWSSPFP